MRTSFTFAIYISINAARVLLISGITRLAWRHVNTGLYSYRASCTREGAHTYDEKQLAAKVEVMLSGIQLTGVMLICLALAVQLPWALILWITSDGLSYEDQDLLLVG